MYLWVWMDKRVKGGGDSCTWETASWLALLVGNVVALVEMVDAVPWLAVLAAAVGAPVGTDGGKLDAETPGFVGNVGDATSPAVGI